MENHCEIGCQTKITITVELDNSQSLGNLMSYKIYNYCGIGCHIRFTIAVELEVI